jgi:hypothetical protein
MASGGASATLNPGIVVELLLEAAGEHQQRGGIAHDLHRQDRERTDRVPPRAQPPRDQDGA